MAAHGCRWSILCFIVFWLYFNLGCFVCNVRASAIVNLVQSALVSGKLMLGNFLSPSLCSSWDVMRRNIGDLHIYQSPQCRGYPGFNLSCLRGRSERWRGTGGLNLVVERVPRLVRLQDSSNWLMLYVPLDRRYQAPSTQHRPGGVDTPFLMCSVGG